MTQIIKYKNIPVMTTEQMAGFYECSKDRIKMNFKRHKDKFTPVKDFYLLKGDELREFRKLQGRNLLLSPNTPQLYLWTEHGIFLHAKSIYTDKAWNVYHELLDTYFRVRKVVESIKAPQTLEEQAECLIKELTKRIEEQQQNESGSTTGDFYFP